MKVQLHGSCLEFADARGNRQESHPGNLFGRCRTPTRRPSDRLGSPTASDSVAERQGPVRILVPCVPPEAS